MKWKYLCSFVCLPFIFGFTAAAVHLTNRASRAVRCTTPTGDIGDCINLNSCQPMKDALRRPTNVNDEKFLARYTCGTPKRGVVTVCCPNKPIILPSQNKHPNLQLLPTECGISDPLDRITNGMQTDLNEFPWQAALKYNTNQKIPYRCGGSLINDRYVLTAAHCIQSKLVLTGVRLGEYDLATDSDCIKDRRSTTCAPPPQDFDVSAEDAIVHHAYNKVTQQDDIALIRLPRPVKFTSAVGPVCLPYKEEFTKRDFKNLTVIGWGATESGYVSTVLLKVTVPYVPIRQCSATFGPDVNLSSRQFCAGGKDGKDSCHGDSGGPIMFTTRDGSEIRYVQAGIVSYGTRICGSEQIPAVYTKTQEYMDWILDNIKP